jgi:hypothetical protein
LSSACDFKPPHPFEWRLSGVVYFGFFTGAAAALTGAAAGFALLASTFFFNFCVFFGLLSPIFKRLLFFAVNSIVIDYVPAFRRYQYIIEGSIVKA